MVAVDPVRRRSIQTLEFLQFGRDDVFEGLAEPRMKDDLAEAVPAQVAGKLLLAFDEPAWTSRRRERRRQVQVEADLDPELLGNGRRALRVFHEHHGAHGGNRTVPRARKRPVRGESVSSQSSAFTMSRPLVTEAPSGLARSDSLMAGSSRRPAAVAASARPGET